MIERNINVVKPQYDWPDNYYMETDASARRACLDTATAQDNSEENRLRLLLWEKRYTNSRGKLDGTDHFLKQWINLPFIMNTKIALFGNKNKNNKAIRELQDVFQTQTLMEQEEHKDVWYREFMNLCCFYIQLSQTDKTYSTTVFGLGKLSDEALAQKLAEDLCDRTVYLLRQLGLGDELSLLADAAKASFALYYPGLTAVYEKEEEKAAKKVNRK